MHQNGYLLDNTPKTVEVRTGAPTIVEFENRQMGGLQIIKKDAMTGAPIAGVKFRVTTKNGLLIGEYVTDSQGHINIPNLEPGWFTCLEIEAAPGYILDDVKKDVEVKTYKTVIVEFLNQPLAGLQILKRDSITKEGLEGVIFEVTKINGELIGRYTTNVGGQISIPDLEPGWYVVTELSSKEGYKIDKQPRNVQLKSNVPSIVEFENHPYAGMVIQKINSVTGKAIPNVKFHITKENGEYVGDFVTDSFGQIKFTKTLTPDTYLVSEISSVDGYQLNDTIYKVELNWGDNKIIQVKNNPFGSLRIVKKDSVTKEKLAGVKFKLENENGILIGEYTTDKNGEILIDKKLSEGKFYLTELKTLDNYVLDKEKHEVVIKWGETTKVELTNNCRGSLKIIKFDSKTKERLAGVRYRLENANGDLIGKYTTDENGEIFLDKKLDAGIFYLIEIDSLDNYITDTEKHKIEISWGKTTIIELKNTEITSKIQIIKRSADNNQYTGTLAGAYLQGAVFEVRDENHTFVEKITTNYDGIATTSSLPYGKYFICEITAPKYWLLSNKEYEVEITENEKVEILEVYNESVKLETDVVKTGVRETQCLDEIRYDFSNISNKSNVSLDNFVWHDSLPLETDLQRVFTGTWNENLVYRVVYKTNFDSNYKVFKDNLFTSQNYELDFTTVPLQIDEKITDVFFEFGTVRAGFSQVEAPFIFVKVKNYLNNGHEFINYTDVGGYYNEIHISGDDSWKTTIYNKRVPEKLPKTGE